MSVYKKNKLTEKKEENESEVSSSYLIGGGRGNKKGKKRFKTKELKRVNYLVRKSRKEQERKRRHHKRASRRSKEVLAHIPKKPQQFFEVEAPSNFSLIENTEAVLHFFKENKKLLASRKQVGFNLRDIKKLTPDAIALLIAKVKDENFTNRLVVRGNSPQKADLKKMFDESGFLEHVRSSWVPERNEKNVLIHQITNNKVENEIAKDISKRAVAHTFGTGEKYRPIYEILIECMANTKNHAGMSEGEYNWWIFEYSNPDTKVTTISFLDLGTGIFNSIPVQSFKRNAMIALKDKTGVDFIPNFNLNLLTDLFEGKISSKTGMEERGQGLPLIYDRSGNQQIKNFTIISNDVYVKIPSKESIILKNKFQGTFLYWELHPRK